MVRGVRFLMVGAVAAAALMVAGPPGQVEAGGGCHGSAAARLTDERTTTVLASDCVFMPTVVRADAGEPVTWMNNDDFLHTFTGVAFSFGTYTEYSLGQSATYSFEKPGVYPYFCALHPGMVGAVIVGDVSASAAGAVDAAQLVSAQASGNQAADEAHSATAEDSGTGMMAIGLVVGAAVMLGGATLAFVRIRRSPTRTALTGRGDRA